MAVGSVILSFTLEATERFDLFMIIAAALTIVGALCFFATGRDRRSAPEAAPRLA